MSELICLGTYFIMCFALIACVYLGRTAIFVYAVGCVLVSNITISKHVEFLGMTTSLGVFIFSVTYLANAIITEYWGRVNAIRLVLSSLFAQVAFMAYSMAAIWTPHAPKDAASDARSVAIATLCAPTDATSVAIATLFTVTPRVTIAAIVASIGGVICVALFSNLKKKYRKGWIALAVRNSVSTILGNWVNTVLFFVIAFYGIDKMLGQVILSAIIAKFTLGILDTPFMFLARWAKNKNPANKTSETDWASA